MEKTVGKKIVYLPLDGRPCNAAFAAALSEGADFRFAVPPDEFLGKKKIPADCGRISAYLSRECADADALILSVDMLLYGGIVPSRLHHLTEEELEERLSLVSRLKRENPKLKIYAFALLMRCPSYSSADEEPDYYETCGREIFLTGQAEHRFREGLLGREEYELALAEYGKKTKGYLSDYLARRAVNLRMVVRTVALYGKGIDFLVLPQDDSAPYGYTAMDRMRLFEAIGAEGLKKPDVYPGADEAGMVLLARAVNEMKGARPRVAVRYAAEEGKETVPLYEDRPLKQTVSSQIAAAGCGESQGGEADMTLFINVLPSGMKDISQSPAPRDKEALAAFTDEMTEELGKSIVLAADVAYCNGGDAEWLRLLCERKSYFRLGGYAGWNTSSNTLGTAIAEGVFYYHYGNTVAHEAFLAERAYEDAGYCGYVRQYVSETALKRLGLNWFCTDGTDGEIARTVKNELERYMNARFPEIAERYQIARCEMPWSRMFETALSVEKRNQNKN